MNLEINCPHCNILLQVDSAWGGKRMACASCSGAFMVPAIASAGAAPKRRSAAAPSRGRRQDRDWVDDEEHGRSRTRRHHGTNPAVPIVLTVVVLAVVGVIVFAFTKRSDQTLFEKPEEVKRTYTQEDAFAVVESSTKREQNYRTAVRNIFNADSRTSMGVKTIRDMEVAKTTEREFLYGEVLRLCDGIDPTFARIAADRYTTEWEKNELAYLQKINPEGGSGGDGETAGNGGAGDTVVKSEAKPDEASAIQKEDRRIDKNARTEIEEFVASITVPDKYRDRAQWLAAELAQLREEARDAGVNCNGFAYRVARCERLFEYLDSWASPEDRSKRSFKWAADNMRILKDLRDQWRAWSAGKNKRLSKENLEAALRDIVRDLEKADTIFTTD